MKTTAVSTETETLPQGKSSSVLYLLLCLHWCSLMMDIVTYNDFVEKQLGGTLQYASFILTSRCLITFFANPFWGSLSDKIGRKQVMLANALGSLIAMSLSYMSTSPFHFFVSRILLGFCYAFPVATSALISDRLLELENRISKLSPKEREKVKSPNFDQAMGFVGAMAGIGFLLSVPFGGIIGAHYGLGIIPAISTGGFFLLLVLTLVFVEDSDQKKSTSKGKNPLEGLTKMWNLFFTPVIGPVVVAKLLGELGVALNNNALLELMRKNTELGLDPSMRGIFLSILGLVCTIVMSNVQTIKKLFGGSAKAAIITGYTAAAIFSIIIPFTNDLNLFFVTVGIYSVSTCFEQPLMNSIVASLSKREDIGVVLSVGDSFVAFGSIISPLSTAYLTPIYFPLPFFLGSICLLILLTFLLKVREKKD